MPNSFYKSNTYSSISAFLASYYSAASSFPCPSFLALSPLISLFKGKRVRKGTKKQIFAFDEQKRPSPGDSQ